MDENGAADAGMVVGPAGLAPLDPEVARARNVDDFGRLELRLLVLFLLGLGQHGDRQEVLHFGAPYR